MAAVIIIGPVFTPHGPDIVEPTHMESPRGSDLDPAILLLGAGQVL